MDADGLRGMLQAVSRAMQSSPPDDSVVTCLLGLALGLVIALVLILAILHCGPSHKKDKRR